jgi:hypothetical protein
MWAWNQSLEEGTEVTFDFLDSPGEFSEEPSLDNNSEDSCEWAGEEEGVFTLKVLYTFIDASECFTTSFEITVTEEE